MAKRNLALAKAVQDKHRRSSALLDKEGHKINKKSEQARIFGTRGDPTNKEHREKQIAALSRVAEHRYGVPVVPSKGKIINEETGERKQGSKSKSPKPDWRSGELESEQTSQAVSHEMGHIETLPKHIGLKKAQAHMDEGSAKAGREYKGAAKTIQEEIQPMAAENRVRKLAGIPSFARPQAMSPIHGESSKVPLRWEHPARKSADTGEEYATRVKGKKGQPLDLIAQTKNLSPEHKKAFEEKNLRIQRFHPERGTVESHSGEALINLRGQGRHEEAKRRLKERGAERFADGGAVKKEFYVKLKLRALKGKK